MNRFVCVHGHFYQPPRENPFLEAVELQDSAYPYHDWNERITAECYAPNGTARILDENRRISAIVNNYARINFNFGPTLLSWLENRNPETYDAILAADKDSRKRFDGHGSAMAQAYSHMIMPLATRRDKTTQVRWGIRDFISRFGREPEGMWLPETAVDVETLDILAAEGIRFTVLAPHQAARVRPKGSAAWKDVSGGRIDPTTAYEMTLPSGRSIAIFFYDGPISRAVAFEKLLSDGATFARRLLAAFSEKRTWPQLAHIATDGETYGHHHRYGEMALAFALDALESGGGAQLINYGAFLERFPPTHEVEIEENTSWSCAHGIERWRSDCGCNSGMRPGWNQAWRAPLREALDWLRDRAGARFETAAGTLLKDPWAARDAYIDVVLDRSPAVLAAFLAAHANGPVGERERVLILKLMELQRQLMLMYTSCGWFFDDLSGIETVQILQYAGRAIQLAEELFNEPLEAEFTARVAHAKSNHAALGNGAAIYQRLVKPAMVDLLKVGAHYAISSLFEETEPRETIYSTTVRREDHHTFGAGKARMALGRIHITSKITQESAAVSFGVLHLGDHNLSGGVRIFENHGAYGRMIADMSNAFGKADFPEIIRTMDRHFGTSTYSLKSLFRDEQRAILNVILASTLSGAEAAYRQIYDHNAPLMRYLLDLNVPLPHALQTAAEFVLNINLRTALEKNGADPERVRQLIGEAETSQIAIDKAGLGRAVEQLLEDRMRDFLEHPDDVDRLAALEGAGALLKVIPFDVNLWRAQNLYDRARTETRPAVVERATAGDSEAARWLTLFSTVGEQLYMRPV